ncbi:MAG: hypothetical protein HYU27_06170 [Acidobacteria bacterium]|nr:hypothetical protein [Acidobacteriota bacterium]
MRHRLLMSMGVLAALLLAVQVMSQTRPPSAAAPKAAATLSTRAWAPPKTPWGDPDLQGTWTSDDYIGTPLQRDVNLGEKKFFTEQEIAEREAAIARQAATDLADTVAPGARVTTGPPGHWGERARRPPRQTSLVVDPPNGRIPALTPQGQTRNAGLQAARQRLGPAGSWESYSFYIRCITRGPTGSIFPVIYGNGQQIVQGPGFVTLLQEMVHEARVIPLDGRPHAGPNIRTYMGDSRGRWEGNTLVVETTNFLPDKTGVQGGNGGGPPTSDALKLTERFTRVDPNTLNYEVTIDDPKTYTSPWKVAFPLTQEPGYQNFEYACHEGNYAMFNSLSGGRADDKAAEEAARQK